MVVGVAEQPLDHRHALEVVADLVLLAHADPAVQLDRVLTDEPARLGDLHFRGGDAAAARDRIAALLVERHRGEVGHRARQLDLDEHLGHAVLQRLERRDRHAELLALLRVLDGRLEHRGHQPERFGAQRGVRVIEREAEQPVALAERADHRRVLDANAVETNVGDVVSVFGRVGRHARRSADVAGTANSETWRRSVVAETMSVFAVDASSTRTLLPSNM